MKRILALMTGLFVFAAMNVWALSVDSLTATGADSASGPVTVSATISGASSQGAMATFQVTSSDGLTRRYFYPTQASGTSWSSSEWTPYFTGTFIIELTAFDNNHQSAPVTATTTVTVTRAVSGTVNGIKFGSLPYNATGVWNNVDTSIVKLHDIGLNQDAVGVGSIGCNLLNANPGDTSQMTEEERDVAYTDTVGYKPAGTPYRFDVSLHARPRGFMGMGEIKRWIWTPYDTNSPDGPGVLVVDIASCSPWRSSYSNALQSHVGFAPLFAPSGFAQMPTGMIQCTSAHYMDVGPTNTGSDLEVRCGLHVNGHTGTNSYVKTFFSDTFLQQQFGLTNALDATNILAGFVQHFTTNGVPMDNVTQVSATFTRIEGGTNNIVYDYNFDGIGDSGYELRLNFEFHSAVAAQFGVASPDVEGDFDADGKADPYMTIGSLWYIWFSGTGYQLSGGPWNFGVDGFPAPADFDADGKADPCMVVDTLWYIWFSGTGYQLSGGPWNFGVDGFPVAADFDADGKADPCIVAGSLWYIWFSGTGYQLSGGPWNFGVAGYPVAGDFDADGKADPCIVADSLWYIWFSGAGYQLSGGPWNFGVAGLPVVGDFDGDLKADPAMMVGYNWTIWMSSLGYAPQGPFPFIP